MSSDAESKCERHVLTLEGSIAMAFRRIPACPEGFLMGSRGYSANEEPMHRVVIPEDFWMADTPVTQAQFAVWTHQAQIDHKNFLAGPGDLPAESMTWQHAMSFCRWLTDTHASRFPKEFPHSELPCEARWEYACRAGTATEYHTGDGEAALRVAGWYSKDWTKETTHRCGVKYSNAFGLNDMHGNVWEWCLDRWDAAAYRRRWDAITDRETFELNETFCKDQVPSRPNPRVVRGGSKRNSAGGCRSAFRYWNRAGDRDWLLGFRVCLVRSPLFSQPAEAEPERTALERRDEATEAGSDGEAEKF